MNKPYPKICPWVSLLCVNKTYLKICPWVSLLCVDKTYLKICPWVSLLCVDKAGEESRVSNEEDWCVVTDQVPVTFFSVELDGKPSWISCRVS